jgi:RNA polymerase sigma-70 factor (ECF subfamily)
MRSNLSEEIVMNAPKPSNLFEEAALLQLASKGDLEAFNQIVLHYQNLAYSHAYALLGDADSAEDATQDGFIRAFQAMNAFRGGSFRGWLLKIVTNSAYDILRRTYRHPNEALFPIDENGEEVESPVWLADPSASVEQAVEQHESSRQIYDVLDELPEVYRTVITLVDINELDYAEAAQALRVPIGTIKSRLARARILMQKKLRESWQPGPAFTIAPMPCAV